MLIERQKQGGGEAQRVVLRTHAARLARLPQGLSVPASPLHPLNLLPR
jgi:hypothetical protein